jgi:UDP-N-acetylmuramoyl-tripeptide--D-alanyl-D-alanine ligase
VTNALAAIAVGASHNVTWPEIQTAVAAMKPEKMRGQVIRLRDGIAVIDDSYNSNPKALTEMIRFMGRVTGFSRKIVVAGEMLELGKESAGLHRACGEETVRSGVNLDVGVQGMAKELLNGARIAGLPESSLMFMPDSSQAGEFLARAIQPGDVVLLKGSRGVKLEKVLEALQVQMGNRES